MTNTGEKFYLGLSVSFLDQKAAIPVLTPDRERLLEYDITRSISQVAQAKKPVIGIMSNLPVLGRSLDPVKKQQPTDPWVLASELKRIFDVRKVDLAERKSAEREMHMRVDECRADPRAAIEFAIGCTGVEGLDASVCDHQRACIGIGGVRGPDLLGAHAKSGHAAIVEACASLFLRRWSAWRCLLRAAMVRRHPSHCGHPRKL
jgi:hypothetical protein